jgi:putative protein-disulfide isomerase
MAGPHLIYFADPMCSWCWGFSPVIGEIRARFGADLPIRLVMGGLRPGNTVPMDDAARARTRAHWEHVTEASGQPFDFAFFDRPGFVYDSEPPSRAVVALRRHGMEAALDGLAALHAALYARNLDVTNPATLMHIAGEMGFDREAFAADLASPEVAEETRADFALARRAGVAGFPTLIAGRGADNRYDLITYGFQRGETVLPSLERWLAAA